MNLIVAVDENWGIGFKNKLLLSLPSDMKHFVDMTKGKTVIMGRKTLATFPGGMPLKNRKNIVFSKALKDTDGVVVVSSFEDFKQKTKGEDIDNIFVIGGEKIYRLLLPYTKFAYITKINKAFLADTYFPNLDELENWKVSEEIGDISENGVHAKILKYENFDVKPL